MDFDSSDNKTATGWPIAAGEMAHRVREHDWAVTALGPIERWPVSLRTIIETALSHPLPTIVLWGRELIQIYNDACRDFMGASHPASLGTPARECRDEACHVDAASCERVWQGESVSLEETLFPLTRSGRQEDAWLWRACSPVRDESGCVAGMLLTIVPAAAQPHVDAALRETQARQAFLLRLSDTLRPLQGAQAIKRQATRLLGEQLGVNRAFYAEVQGDDWIVVKGYEQGTVPLPDGPYSARTFGDWVMATYRAGECLVFHDSGTDTRFSPAQRQAHADVRILAAVGVPLIKEGALVAILAVHSATPRRWSDAELALLEEAAERTWAAVERARAERALAASEAHLRAVLDALPVGVVIADAQGRLLQDNAAHRALWGMQPHATSWEQYGEWVGFWPESGRRIAAPEWAMARALRAGEVVQGELVECQPFGGGPRRSYLNNAAPVRDAAGQVVGGVVVELDVTERLQAQEQLRSLNATLEARVAQRTAELAAARDAAEAASRVKSQFLANMSHEIRTPLNAILGLTHLLGREAMAPQQVQRLKKIEGASRHLLSIINDILDLSKIEAGKLHLEGRDFSLLALLDNVTSMISSAAAAKGLRILVDATGAPPWLHGDETRVRQALLNYASNAVKFTSRGSITLRTELLQEQGTRLLLRFTVQDTGIGIPAQALPRLFDAFEQAEASTNRKFGGTGLGLAITKRFAEIMGGSAGAQSEPGHGSAFWFTAWLGRGQPLEPATVQRTQAESWLRQRHSGARVLLADDNEINREVAVELMRAAGLEVQVAEDGQVAVEKMTAGGFDLVLMDVQMPVVDGLSATRMLRTDPRFAQLPILAMTANAFDEDRAACLAAGMNDFVGKPVEPGELYATLGRWLPVSADMATPVPAALPVSGPGAAREDLVLARLERLPGFNVHQAVANLLGMKDRYLALLRMFCEHHSGDAQRIAQMIDSGELGKARLAAHSLKGAAATLGAHGIAELAAAVESHLASRTGGVVAVDMAGWVDELGLRLGAVAEAAEVRSADQL